MKNSNVLSQEAITRRLAIIKHLYLLGLEQSQHVEKMAFPCILIFHDAVEFFLRLVAEKEGVNADKLAFSEYWFKIPTLTLKESMRNFNSLRVNLKHYGQLPAKEDLDISRANITAFLKDNTQIFFQQDFEAVSLIDLVGYESVRSSLREADALSKAGKMKEAIESVTISFADLVYSYEESKTPEHSRYSPFHFGDELRFWGGAEKVLSELSRDLAGIIRNMARSVEALQEAMKITALGLDFRKYSQFRILTPRVHRWDDSWEVNFVEEKNWSASNVQFCINFVIDSALKLQTFDFELENLLVKSKTKMEYVSGTFETGLVMREVNVDDRMKEDGTGE